MHRPLVVVAVLLVAPAAAAEEVTLTFESKDIAQVALVEPLGSDEKSTCITPCIIRVAPGRYHVAAEGPGLRRYSETVELTTSRDFRLRTASSNAYYWGVALMAIGGAFTFMGLYVGLPAAIVTASGDGDGSDAAIAAGVGGMGLVGLVPLVSGLLLMRGNRPGPEN
jgi:hypothetical protein